MAISLVRASSLNAIVRDELENCNFFELQLSIYLYGIEVSTAGEKHHKDVRRKQMCPVTTHPSVISCICYFVVMKFSI